jgi:integrase
MALPRYIQARTTAYGVVEYRFNPPQKLVDAGVVTRRQFGSDLKQVRKLVREDNQRINDWYDKNATVIKANASSTLTHLIDAYCHSQAWKMLRPKTQKDYKYFLSVAQKTLGRYKVKAIGTKLAKKHYQLWLEQGVTQANHITSCMSTVYNWAFNLELVLVNPFSRIKRVTALKRTDVWTRQEVRAVLDDAYSNWYTRNIGLIIHMALEFCQRLGDMRNLKWDSLSDDMAVLYLQQSKRRAKVEIPVEDDLREMLLQKKKDFGFQQYVAPRVYPIDGEYLPYTLESLSKRGRLLMERNGIPKHKRLMDLRRTGIMEMVDGGVPLPQIMSVSGHSNPASVKPYMKNTLASATNALTTRKTWVSSALKQQEGV